VRAATGAVRQLPDLNPASPHRPENPCPAFDSFLEELTMHCRSPETDRDLTHGTFAQAARVGPLEGRTEGGHIWCTRVEIPGQEKRRPQETAHDLPSLSRSTFSTGNGPAIRTVRSVTSWRNRRTANKARKHPLAVLSRAWEQELIDSPSAVPEAPRPARRGWATLPDQGGGQRPVLRHLNSSRCNTRLPGTPRLRRCSCCLPPSTCSPNSDRLLQRAPA
jgi:hypothetical protein